MSSVPPKPTDTSKAPPAARFPSLNQLAARINISNPSSTTTAPRPRLPANILRTGSAASTTSTSNPLNASTTTLDSMAVNVPSTRSGSPSMLSISPPKSITPSVDSHQAGESEAGEAVGEGDPLTEEQLEKHNLEMRPAVLVPKKQKVPLGYKGVPSLDAITARLVKARTLSIDGSARPPEPETVDDPKTPGVKIKAPEHPLQYPWTIYHDTKPNVPYTPSSSNAPSAPNSASHSTDVTDYEAGLTIIGEFDTVESFCRYFNWLKPPSKLERNSNYHLFKSGIKPMWEDPANASGGKWVLTMKNNPTLLDRCWSWLAMALVGEELEEGDDICGAVVSLRSKVDRIQVWTRSKEDVEKLNRIGKKLVKLLDVSEADGIGLEFQYNTEDRPLPNKFLSIHALPNSSYRSTFQPSNSGSNILPSTNNTSVGGAFASFGVGIGASTWKSPMKRTV
ncbi:translation initiation factor eIF4e [Amanita rubescens]|nr:translation initiation factor eIF4e [Amanita rubescens]